MCVSKIQQTPGLDLSTVLHLEGSCCILTYQCEAEPFLPLRVIDVGNAPLLPRVHLHPRSLHERGHYATLSYCWGGKMPLVTTRKTLKQHLQSLNIQDLPLMFRDAITITRLLGIRYLWIDALCIVQDDHQDWGNQAPRNGFNISAFSRDDCRTLSKKSLGRAFCGEEPCLQF